MSDPFAILLQKTAQENDDVLIWTICYSPSDHPGKFTARPHSARTNLPMLFLLTANKLDDLRSMLPPGLTHLSRDVADDPVIVESWI